jgi:hypothetical protein
MTRSSSTPLTPSDFMRSRRPELFPDTEGVNREQLTRNELEYHLETLTQRKEENRFEHFCRRLAEKELCPNLRPQTGPTGGGDSGVDSETYPVAPAISGLWYEADPTRPSQERWAFAFSAKKKWREKAGHDLGTIAATGRSYKVAYFVTNQAVRDRDRATVEDRLTQKFGIQVQILDRTWIIEKVTRNQRWNIVFETLDIARPTGFTQPRLGPRDTDRIRQLEELDSLIQDQARYVGSTYQKVEDSLQTALIARGLGRARTEVDGRFDRAERLARERRDNHQLFRIRYHRAWTSYWWFDDAAEFDRLYRLAEPLVVETGSVWEIADLVTLWQLQVTSRHRFPGAMETHDLPDRTALLRQALMRGAALKSEPSAALWARTQLALMGLTEALRDKVDLASTFTDIRNILREAEGLLDYPTEPLITIVSELGRVVSSDPGYDALFNDVLALQERRAGKAEKGRLRLRRAIQQLKANRPYDAIDQGAKAQTLLAQDETKDDFLMALAVTASGYEAVGLLWAARSNLLIALDRLLYGFVKGGKVDQRSLPILRRLIWLALQLGRVPCVLIWSEWLRLIASATLTDQGLRDRLSEEYEFMDAVLGILLLRTHTDDWQKLDRLPALLDREGFTMARGAALFALGYEDAYRVEYKHDDPDLDTFFSKWANQPAADDLPPEAEWHLGRRVRLGTVILGCEISLLADNNATSIVLGEATLSFLEAFLSTTLGRPGYFAAGPRLRIDVAVAGANDIVSCRRDEDECGETIIRVSHHDATASELASAKEYQDLLFDILAASLVGLQLSVSKPELEELFSKDRAQDRALLAAQLPRALANVLGNAPKYHLGDWLDATLSESFILLRDKQWTPTSSDNPDKPKGPTASPAHVSVGTRPNFQKLKHRHVRVYSPINLSLWDRAKWIGVGFALEPGATKIAIMALVYSDPEAGEKIFKGWRREVGEVDTNELIGITLVTGINRRFPSWYRVVIGANADSIPRGIDSGTLYTFVSRINEMQPEKGENLSRFLDAFAEAGEYRLTLGRFSGPLSDCSTELSITKHRIRIIEEWQIGPSDPARIAVRAGDDPIVPECETSPPIRETLAAVERDRSKAT